MPLMPSLRVRNPGAIILAVLVAAWSLPAVGADRSCGLQIDGQGPGARCARYERTCLRDANSPRTCAERRSACETCAGEYRKCELRVGRLTGLLLSCQTCLNRFKRCTHAYNRRYPIARP